MVPGVSSGAMAGQQAAGVGVAAGAAVAGGAEERVDDRRVRRGPVAGRRAATAGTPECERAADAGVPFAWVTGDEACGGNPKLGRRLEERRLPYVMAVACSEPVAVQAGSFRADDLAAVVPAGAWQLVSCADGSKGPRLYDWALIETADAGHWLLARRSLNRNARGELELAFFCCWSPRPVTLAELVAVAGARWGAEDCFSEAKNETGLDHYQVRKYQAWYRHVTLSMLAHAFLAVTAHATGPEPTASGNDNGEPAKKGIRGLWTDLRPAEDV